MMTAEQNERVTRVGPGTPCGALLRRYWQPVALVDELQGDRPVVPVTVLGEHLVLFRDGDGTYGLIDRRCRHRGADLAFGRIERGGLRCPFHGWLYDVNGRCLEQPAEPPGSTFHRKVRQPAYPCVARNGIVFAYLGEGEPPALPAFDCFAAPDSFTFAFKGYYDCNWLQALEVGIDPAHASFLHRFFEDEDPADGYGRQFRDQTGGIAVTKLLREYDCPRLEVEDTDYGLRIFALRDLDGAHTHVRVTNLMFPNAFVIPMSADINITQWHVPVDDVSNYWYAAFTAFDNPVDKQRMRAQRLESCTLPDYKPRRNRGNDWGYDPAEQRTKTFTGMGMDINVHDQWAVESPGQIQDRAIEHLGTTDKAIIAYRKKLVRAIEANGNGGKPPFVLDAATASRLRGPIAIDTIGPSAAWQGVWRTHDAERRERSAWAQPVQDA
jgi:hypothetical protein